MSSQVIPNMSATKETLPASNIILRQPTGSPIPHILLYVVQVVALASPSFHGRRFLFSNAIVILALLSMINPHFTNNVALAQPCTVGWSYYLSTLEKMLFSGAGGPEGTLWHRDRPPKEDLAFRGFGFQKLKWATALIVNTRGIRWNFQIKNVPKRGNTTKFKFVVSQAIAFVRFLFMTDLVCQLGIHLFYTAPDGQVGTLDSKYLTLCDRFWIWSFAKPVVFGATPYFMLNLQHITFSIAAVLLGLSKPEVGE